MDKGYFTKEETHKAKNIWSKFNINDDWENSNQYINEIPVYTHLLGQKVKSLTIPNVVDDVDLPYDFHVASGNENFCNHFEKTVWHYLLKSYIFT